VTNSYQLGQLHALAEAAREYLTKSGNSLVQAYSQLSKHDEPMCLEKILDAKAQILEAEELLRTLVNRINDLH
jgi:hypothetical protein